MALSNITVLVTLPAPTLVEVDVPTGALVTAAGVRAAVPHLVEVATPAEGDMIQRVGTSWLTRTIAQIKTALGLGTAAYTAAADYAAASHDHADVYHPASVTYTESAAGLVPASGSSSLGFTPGAPAINKFLTAESWSEQYLPNALWAKLTPQFKSASYTAANWDLLHTGGTLTISDPLPEDTAENTGYMVRVLTGTATIGGVTYTPGNLIYRWYNGTAWAVILYQDSAAYATAAQGTLATNALPATNGTIINPTEGVVSIGNSGTAQTIALTSGTFQTVTLTGNCAFTMPTATAGKSFMLKVLTGAGGYTATFTGVKWPAATAATITATAAKYDLISFVADGTAWSGSAIQNFTP